MMKIDFKIYFYFRKILGYDNSAYNYKKKSQTARYILI